MGKNPRRTFIDKLIRKPDRSDQQLVLTPKGCTSSTSACAAQADADIEEKCHRDEKRIAPDTTLPPIIMSSKDGYDAVNATAADTTTGVRQEHQYELEQLPMSTPPEDPGSGLGADPDNSKPQRSKLRMFAIMVALSLALFIAALDQTIMATATPTISAELHSASGYTWIGGAYLLANAAAATIWAKLSDIWGRKPILLLAVTLFFGSSIICASAVDMKMLIAGRALQGTAGGGLIQLVTITVSDLFSVRRRSLYLALLELMWAIAGGVGPVLGGAFTQYVSWRWTYWLNLPVSGLTFVLLLLFLDVHNPRTKMVEGAKAIDWFGCFSILGLTLMLLLGLDFGGVTFPWDSPQVICLIMFGCLFSLLFIYSEKRLARYPLMPLGIFRRTSNVATLAVCFVQGFVFIAGEYYLPLYFQSVQESSPLHSGLLILPLVLTEAVAAMAAGLLINHTGRYLELIRLGVALLTIGNGLYIHLSTTSSLGEIIAVQLVAGIGAGLLFEPPLLSLQAGISQDDTATATATLGFVRNLATSSSIVLGGVVFQNSMALRQPALRAAGLPATLLADLAGATAAANVFAIRTIADDRQRRAVKEAFAWSLRNMWILYTCLSAGGVVASVFITRQVLSKEHTETRTGLKREEEREKEKKENRSLDLPTK